MSLRAIVFIQSEFDLLLKIFIYKLVEHNKTSAKYIRKILEPIIHIFYSRK